MKLFLLTFLFSLNCLSQTILIDPGHGGIEEGALSEISVGKNIKKIIYEKDITLDIAKLLYQKLKKHYRTYLTRSIDRTVTLEERAEMATKVKADFLISIHVNSTNESQSHGFETYYLDNHDNAAVSKVEKLENVVHTHNGKDLEINKILIDLVISKTAKSSKHLAETIHSQLQSKIKKSFKMRDRSLKPGLFYVLALSKIPGVLLEAGFMSNQKELTKLISKDFQEQYAESIYKGILKATGYKKPRQEISLF